MSAESTIKLASLVPVIDSLISFVTNAVEATKEAQDQVAALEAKLADKDRVILEKVAAANKPVFNEAEVKKTLDTLKLMGVIDDGLAVKYATDIKSNPSAILPLLEQISEAAILSGPTSEGMGIEKEAAGHDVDDDPDGWKAYAQGRPVKLKP